MKQGDNSEMQMAAVYKEEARKLKKDKLKQQRHLQSFDQIQIIICGNGGYDSAELIENFNVELQKKRKFNIWIEYI